MTFPTNVQLKFQRSETLRATFALSLASDAETADASTPAAAFAAHSLPFAFATGMSAAPFAASGSMDGTVDFELIEDPASVGIPVFELQLQAARTSCSRIPAPASARGQAALCKVYLCESVDSAPVLLQTPHSASR